MKKPFIIAEVSQNHDGSLGQAHAFIDAVASTGANAIKFQTHIACEESTPDEPFRTNFSYEDATRYDYWRRMEFTEDQWTGLYEHARDKRLTFLSSPFSLRALEMLDRIGCCAWKLGSGEVFNDILLNKAISTGKPILLSTGLSSVEDIDRQVAKIRRNGNDFVVFHCTTEYPSSAESIALNRIQEIKDRYNSSVGISDHSGTIYPSLAAVTLGVEFIEVHVTMSRWMFGPDIKASVTLDDLSRIVEGANFIYRSLKNPDERIELKNDKKELRRIFSKSLYANENLEAGDVLSEKNIAIKKPYVEEGIPVSAYADINGKRLKKPLIKDQPIKWEDIIQ